MKIPPFHSAIGWMLVYPQATNLSLTLLDLTWPDLNPKLAEICVRGWNGARHWSIVRKWSVEDVSHASSSSFFLCNDHCWHDLTLTLTQCPKICFFIGCQTGKCRAQNHGGSGKFSSVKPDFTMPALVFLKWSYPCRDPADRLHRCLLEATS